MDNKKLRVVFFGTPESVMAFAEQLYKSEELIGIVTQPPKIAGRGFHLVTPPVGKFAKDMHIPYFHPDKLTEKNFIDEIAALAPDIGVVAAFGKKIPGECLALAKQGFINIHYSLLPKYRGPAPIQHALLNGESITGVTIFFLTEHIDEGPVIMQQEAEIGPDDNYETLEKRLTLLGQEMLIKTLDLIRKGQTRTYSQAGLAVKAPIIKKEHGKISWEKNAYKIIAQIKALQRWPKAFFKLNDGTQVKVTAASIYPQTVRADNQPGTVAAVIKDKGFVVQSGDVGVLIERLHPESKKEMSAWAYWQSKKIKIGDVLK